MKRQNTASPDRIKRSGPAALIKLGRMLLYKYKGALLQQSDPHSQEIELMTVSVPTRAVIALLYRNVQQDDCPV